MTERAVVLDVFDLVAWAGGRSRPEPDPFMTSAHGDQPHLLVVETLATSDHTPGRRPAAGLAEFSTTGTGEFTGNAAAGGRARSTVTMDPFRRYQPRITGVETAHSVDLQLDPAAFYLAIRFTYPAAAIGAGGGNV